MAITKRKPKPPSVEDLGKTIQKQIPSLLDFKRILQDIYITPITSWSTCSVRRAIDQHDVGVFNQSGRLVDAMMRDPRIFACCNTLVYGVLGLKFEWKWPEKYQPTEEDEHFLEITNKWWAEFTATSAPATIIKWVANMGTCILGKSWNLDYLYCDEEGKYGKLYLPETHVFHPANTYYNTASKTYYVYTYSHGVIEVDEKDPRLQVVKHVDSERPFMQGAVRPLGLVWLDKWMALSDWRSYLSIFGNPLRILTTDREFSTPPEFDIEQFIQNMATAFSYGAPLHLMEGQKLDLLQAQSSNAGVFTDKIEEANKEIAIVYLGQNLTTDVSKGSFASAKVHDNVRQDYIEAYTTTLNRAMYRIVKEFYYFNFPDNLVVPEPYFNPDPPANELEQEKIKSEKAKSLKDISDSLDKLSKINFNDKSLLDMIQVEELLKKFS